MHMHRATWRFTVLALAFAFGLAAHATTAIESTFTALANDQPSQILEASDGNFYGTASTGGTGSFGYVFKITPGGVPGVLYSFTNAADGGTPKAGLIEGNDGNLYGTNTTGASGSGVLFRITFGGAITPLHAFASATDGGNAGALITDAAGDLYGAATQGGTSGKGTVFVYTHGGSFQLIHTFTGTSPDGALPNTPLLQASDGMIYGVTARGGTLSNSGSLFRFDPASFASFTTYASFPPTSQSDPAYNPVYGLTEGQDGNLYGLTAEGGNGYGSIYKVTPGATPSLALNVYEFKSATDGGIPASGLLLGGDGNFYGTTSAYGPAAGSHMPSGTFFQYIPSGTGTLNVLYKFLSPRGNSYGTPLEASNGNIYGPMSKNAINRMTLTPTVPAAVSITPSSATITLGQPVTISWNVTNAFSLTAKNCVAHGSASGAWSGPQAATGSQTFTPITTGAHYYGLTCGGVESAFARVIVNPLPITQTAAPVISPGAGLFYGPHPFKIVDYTHGAVIHYTTDGSTPTLSSPVWDGYPTVIVETTTVKAVAIAPPLTVSPETDATIHISTKYATCTIHYETGFTAGPGLVLNHGASLSGTTLEMTHNLPGESTSAFALPRIPVKTYAMAFTFRFTNANATAADGLTFTLQADSPKAVGAAGGGLGYQGILNSMAVKFDLHNNNGEGPNSVGVFYGGNLPATPAVDLTPSGIDLHSGHKMLAGITSDGTYLTLGIQDETTKAIFEHVFTLPTTSPFGSATTVYAGFTAGTGKVSSNAEVFNWLLESDGNCGTN